MRAWAVMALACGMGVAPAAYAYEYPLQFVTGGNVANRHVAGYAYVGSTVTGDCTYTRVGACSGRGCHPSYTTYYQGCTWDLYGNLLGVTAGEPAAPTPISTSGGVIVYAENAQGGTTGIDTAHGNLPFVNTISALYAWVSPPNVVFLQKDKPYPITFTVQSLGDLPLAIGNVAATATLGALRLKSTTCQLSGVRSGTSCTLVMNYNPTRIPHADDPYTAYDQITLGLVSNSGLAPVAATTVETPIPPGG